MPIPSDDSDLLNAWLTSHSEDLHTAMVARVDSYDHTTQTATVTPVTRTPLKDGSYEEPLTLSDVPIGVYRGGGFFVHVPLLPGDHVLLVFSELSISEWRETGQTSNPKNLRRHSHSAAYAIPCAAPVSGAVSDTSATALTIGRDGTDAQIQVDAAFVSLGKGATDFVALASKVDSGFASLVTYLTSHTHTYNPGPLAAAPTTPPIVPPTSVPTVVSTVTKVK